MCETSNVTRREALQYAGTTGVAFLFAGAVGTQGAGLLGADVAEAAAATCVLTPEKTEGPYFVDEKLNRSDITEGQAGTALAITMYVFDANGDCAPVEGATVDMWHANASGKYGDIGSEGTSGQTWLRGHQVSDADGKVTFNTIWPGWYSGRAVHIHFKVRYGSVEFTSQMFFTDAMNTEVFKSAPYSSRGNPTTTDSQDGILGGDADTLMLAPTASGSGYKADFSVGLAQAGTVTPPAADTAVEAAIGASTVVRTATGKRQLRISLTPDEDVTLVARLTRDGRRLARRKVTVTPGARTVRVDLGSRVKPGAARLALKLSDAAGNSRTFQRSVHVPRRRA